MRDNDFQILPVKESQNNMNTIEEFNKSVMHTYGRFDLVVETGSDRVCTDENGKEYIDFGSGIGTNSLGF